ncbi:NADH dehydrogenase [ubiquinone] 1 alpha subcomplex assembly factor 2 [Ornithorhynchus anatinus]|nr:NADH dehydrogenase [ubiquinone] 1 alpha subcomplex assembly factor 2 [Ornithorhynchus anatinus]
MSGAWAAVRGLAGALRRAVGRHGKQHVGTDPLGNNYYFVPRHKNWRGQIIREKRFVEAAGKKEEDYEVGDIPTEWEAWIRKKRKEPPTIEEIMKNEKYREDIKIKSREFSEKEKLLQAGESQERLAAPPGSTLVRGHASAQLYGKSEPSEDPTSTGRDFQPGSWRPRGGED